MEPVTNSWCNAVYLGNGSHITDLPCRRDTVNNMPAVFSFWKPTESELEQLNRGASVRLGVYMEPTPPVSVDVIFTPEDVEN